MEEVLHPNQLEENKKLSELIQDIEVAMLTTIDVQGKFHSRPMITQKIEFNGDLWFLTAASSHKVIELNQRSQVLLTYASPEKQRFVSVYGQAKIMQDQAKINELWHTAYYQWFPKGPTDPNIILLKIEVDQAEYWDSKLNKITQLYNTAKSVITGESDSEKYTEHKKFDIAV